MKSFEHSFQSKKQGQETFLVSLFGDDPFDLEAYPGIVLHIIKLPSKMSDFEIEKAIENCRKQHENICLLMKQKWDIDGLYGFLETKLRYNRAKYWALKTNK